jgi:hypothetical protein
VSSTSRITPNLTISGRKPLDRDSVLTCLDPPFADLTGAQFAAQCRLAHTRPPAHVNNRTSGTRGRREGRRDIFTSTRKTGPHMNHAHQHHVESGVTAVRDRPLL